MEQPEEPTQTQTQTTTPPTSPTADPAPDPTPGPTPGSPDDLATVRELILLAYRDVVPELVQGGTIAELRAAVEPARAAYRQVAERIAGGTGAAPPAAPPSVPAGAAGGPPPIDGLPPGELIKRGLQRRG